jgi:Protein of unknown function (DUF1553)/Protein of unknown function (DUF1549)/Concanavalin A-like lectin/glucanases superfamily/Planctomycete cytochrome C
MYIRAASIALFLSVWPALCADRAIQFNRDVRPILSDKCYGCHGPDAVAKKIPLRLDSEAGAKADLGSGRRAVVEGDAAASQLVQRITTANKGMHMPPVYSGLKLSGEEIETLRLWIAQGAKWQKHWSFIPPERPTLPKVSNPQWPRNPIDNFVLARLDHEKLTPAPEASRETLLRRVTLDLTGLSPTPGELDAFLKDKSPNAYEKVVDRLLASSRYGERMAERWLDGARYADSNGYQYDGERFMWRWRDWVINSFNRNQPFNQFTLEQIAGDMLPNATLSQKMATGFNRNHRANTEDGIVPEEYAVEYVVDRVETTSTVFLGLTLGCARCHNHKYDPFTQKEFYQVYAYFNNVPENGRAIKYGNSPPTVPAPTEQQQQELKVLESEIRKVEKNLPAGRDLPACAANPEPCPAYWYPPDEVPLKAKAEGEVSEAEGKVSKATVFDGKAFLDGGDAGNFDIDNRFTLSAWIYAGSTASGSIMSRMTDNPKGKGFGLQLNNGKVHMHLTSSYDTDAIRVETEETLEPKRWYHITATYDGSIMAQGVHLYIDGKPAKTQVHSDNLYRPFRNAGKIFKEKFRVGGGTGPANRFRGMIDGVHIYGRMLSEDEIGGLALGETVAAIARKPSAARSESESQVLRWYALEYATEPATRETWKQYQSLKREKEKLERSFTTVMVMAESPVRKQTHMLIRGAYDKPGDLVEPGIPSVLPPLPAGAPNNRLGFAKWLVSPQNPLLARVTMNRFWQMYFGTGIVKTIEDFGSQGEWPSHPELIDWLATEFMRSGWDTKAMQKLIVTSAAYRQSSQTTPELMERDPENRLLAHGPRFRLPAEMIRDQALYVAGLLTDKVGGPSIKPYQPAGLWKELSMQDMDYVQSKGADLYRRSLYIFWKRTIAPPMMMNFDAAQRESCVVRETRTNTPLQALDLMNDVTFVEAARFLGQRMMEKGGADPASRLRYGFRAALGRDPSENEARILRDNLNYHRDYFAGKKDSVDEYLKEGDSPSDPALDRRDLAAYASVASLILNMDEMVTKQ